ncbi:hypothetical protein [Enteractinococcus coprophilus]|uniref:LPXTG-motif cell wall-anchored protein n=1 Tax=Enteractinococcus coprophilus TaxID=1027633 RepID=A0A543AGJ5_9MICC|nr:hypothetical protein [Enteractinococcus coprophilus]TQL71692.1 hypothetical protein FB556_2187 [Enteractinococcus coprophilus]
MKLRPVLSASAIGVLIATVGALPSFATDDETPREREVSVTPVAPTPDVEDDPTPSPSGDTESASEDAPEDAPGDEDPEEDDETQTPPAIEYLLESTAEPTVRPSVQAPEPSPVTTETQTALESLTSPFAVAERGSNEADNTRNGAAANNPASAPEGFLFGPQDVPLIPAQAPFIGTDALVQALLDTQSPDDVAPVEERTTGTNEAPGRVESRRIVRPDQPTDAAPQESVSNPQESPSSPEDARAESTEDTRSAPEDSLVTTGAASALLAIGGILMIAGGAGILFWHRRLQQLS